MKLQIIGVMTGCFIDGPQKNGINTVSNCVFVYLVVLKLRIPLLEWNCTYFNSQQSYRCENIPGCHRKRYGN
jgi:hypothetical protein